VRHGTVLSAVDFDLGRQRVAYFDSDTASYHYTPGMNTQGNRGRSYRNDGVDIRPDSLGHHVFHIENGEWLQYTVAVADEGITNLQLRVASETKAGRITVSIDGQTLAQPIAVPMTGGEQKWVNVSVEIPTLTKGKNVIRIQAETGGFNFKSIAFGR
jgi:endoglucanase